jgi:hypothetical protein
MIQSRIFSKHLTSTDQLLGLLYLFVLSNICIFITPWVITQDGVLYLSSGQSLFNSEIYKFYHWMREPLYPLLINLAIPNVGLAGLFFLQGILLSTAIFIVFNILNTFVPLKTYQYYLLISLSFIFNRGYITVVLMQSLMLFIISLFALFAIKIINLNNIKGFSILILVPIALSYYTSLILGICLSFSIIVLSAVNSNLNYRHKFIAVFITLFMSFVVYLPWQIFKNNAINRNEMLFTLVEVQKYRFFESDLLPKIYEQQIQAFAGNLGLGVERDAFMSQPVGFALKSWAMPTFNDNIFNRNTNCGVVAEYNENFLNYIESMNVSLPCKTDNQIVVSNILSYLGILIYPFFSLILIFGFGFILLFPRTKLLSITILPYILLLAYSTLGQGHSRFAAPLFIVSPAIMYYFLTIRRHLARVII